MPLKRALQYAHAAWLSEGINTDWRHASREEDSEARLLLNRLQYLTKPKHG